MTAQSSTLGDFLCGVSPQAFQDPVAYLCLISLLTTPIRAIGELSQKLQV